MKFLFVAGGSQATVFAIAPLATAARNAGHEILIAANEPLIEPAVAVGLPAVAICPEPIMRFMHADRAGNAVAVPDDPRGELLHTGRSFARMAAAGLDALLAVADDWHPDLVIGGSLTYAAPLLAASIKVPHVRQAWDIVPTTIADEGAREELKPELERLGLANLPDPALFVDICPPSLRPASCPGAQLMRWISGNRQRRLEPWMYARPRDRRRVLITSGTRSLRLHTPGSSLRQLVDQLTTAGVEVLIAAPDKAAAELQAEFSDLHVGWIPLDVVSPTCDLVVHHGGGVTSMTIMTAGVPQLIIPAGAYMAEVAQGLSRAGAGLTLAFQGDPGEDVTEAIFAGCLEILSRPGYAERARSLAAEIAALPAPAEVTRTLEQLDQAVP